MPSVKVSDILVPDVWVPYMQEKTAEKSTLFQSGIITQNDQLNEIAKGGGNTANMPFFQDLAGESEVLSDTAGLSVNKITTGKDVAVKHFRGKAWGANDLAGALSGTDPMAAIADLVAEWWSRDMQRTLIATLKGVFAAASMTTHVHSIAIEDGNTATESNKISAESTIDAFSKLGDEIEALTAIGMHSTLYYRLLKQNLIEFEPLSEQGQKIATYLGKRVIVDDGMPRIAGTTSGFKYTTYLFGAGVIGFGEGNPETPVETDRDSLVGEDYLINRRHFILHPGGIKWKGAPVGESPSNPELATGNNWERVYEVKNVKVIALITNG